MNYLAFGLIELGVIVFVMGAIMKPTEIHVLDRVILEFTDTKGVVTSFDTSNIDSWGILDIHNGENQRVVVKKYEAAEESK